MTKANLSSNLLIIDKDKDFIDKVSPDLYLAGFKNVTIATNPDQAVAKIKQGLFFDVALIDIANSTEPDLKILQTIKMVQPDLECAIVTSVGDIKTVVDCMHYGAYEYLVKPVPVESIMAVIHQGLKNRYKPVSDYQASLSQYHLLFQTLKDAVIILDVKTQDIVDVNPAAVELYGYSKERFLTLKQNDLTAEKESSGKSIQKTLNNEPFEVPIRYHLKSDGSTFPVNISACHYRIGGQKMMCGIVKDLSDKVDMEQKLIRSEEKYQNLFNSLHDAYFSMDCTGNILDFNPAFLQLVGYSANKIKTLSYQDITPDPWYLFEKEIIACQVLQQGYSDPYEKEFKKIDGTIVPVELRLFLIKKKCGSIKEIGGIVRDISKRKTDEKLLKESERRYRRLVEGSPDIHYIFSSLHGALYWSPRVTEILGFTQQDLIQKPFLWHDSILPDDLPEVDQAISDSQNGNNFDIEYRIKDKLGHIRWFHDRFIDKQQIGDELVIEGLATDITTQKQYEQSLKNLLDNLEEMVRARTVELEHVNTELEKAHAFRKAIIDRAGEGVCVCLAVPEYPYVRFNIWNDRMTEITGYTMDEINRLGWHQNMYPDTDIQNRAILRMDQMLKGIDLIGEQWEIKRKSGEKRTVLISTSSLNIEEQPGQILAIISDITERKKFENELIQADKMILLGTLVSGVAHEINNPNNFIMLNTSMIKKIWPDIVPILDEYYTKYGDFMAGGVAYSELKQEMPSLLKGIEHGSFRIKNIVADLKDYARNNPDESYFNIDINTALKSALSLLDNFIKKSTSRFLVEYGADLPPIHGNLQKIEQVIINIIGCIRKFLKRTERLIRS